jgi:hypothetical protein
MNDDSNQRPLLENQRELFNDRHGRKAEGLLSTAEQLLS